ncbi:MAG: hypothetical protein AAF688_08525 [Bacteroidota bacterium]
MRHLLISTLFLFSLSVNAQKRKVHTVELLPNETESIVDADFYISEVIDNRLITSNIGIAQKGIFNKKVPAVFSKPFEVEVLDYLNTIFPKDTVKKALAIRINQLLISENTGAFKETGKAIVRLDVLIKIDDENYASYGNFSAQAFKNSMDVTGKHDDRIREIIKLCLVEFDSTDWQNNIAEVISLERPKIPKILTEEIEIGFFRTHLELLNNNSLKSINFEVQNRSTDDKLHLKDTEKNKLVHFAYNDGKDVYLNASTYSGERHYVKTERFDEFLLFSDVFLSQDSTSEMSFAFGVLGLLSSNQRQTVLFDLNTGQFYPLNQSRMKLLLKDNFPELYRKYRVSSGYLDEIRPILKQAYQKLSPEVFREVIRGI